MMEFRKSRGRWARLLVGLVVVAMLGAACGGDDDDDGATAASIEQDGDESSQKADGEPYVFGITHDLSGPLSFRGVPWVAGAKTYASWLNDNGGIEGRPLEIRVLDDRSDVQTAVSNFRELEGSGVIAINGPGLSDASQALQEQATAKGVVLLSDVMPNPANPPKPFIYNPWLEAGAITPVVIAAFVEDLAADAGIASPKVAIVVGDSAAGVYIGDKYTEQAESRGWDVVAREAVSTTAVQSFDAGASTVARAEPDFILMALAGNAAPVAVQSLRQRLPETPIANYLAGAGEAVFAQLADEEYYSFRGHASPTDTENPAVAEMIERAKAAGEDDEAKLIEFTAGYVMTWYLAEALKVCGADCDRDGLNAAYENTGSFDADGLIPPSSGFSPTRHAFITEAAFYHWDPAQEKAVIAGDFYGE